MNQPDGLFIVKVTHPAICFNADPIFSISTKLVVPFESVNRVSAHWTKNGFYFCNLFTGHYSGDVQKVSVPQGAKRQAGAVF